MIEIFEDFYEKLSAEKNLGKVGIFEKGPGSGGEPPGRGLQGGRGGFHSSSWISILKTFDSSFRTFKGGVCLSDS